LTFIRGRAVARNFWCRLKLRWPTIPPHRANISQSTSLRAMLTAPRTPFQPILPLSRTRCHAPPLGPRASRPHRVRTTKYRSFRNPPCLLDPPCLQSRQDAGAPSVPGFRLAAFQIAKIGNWLARSSQGSAMKWLSDFRCSVYKVVSVTARRAGQAPPLRFLVSFAPLRFLSRKEVHTRSPRKPGPAWGDGRILRGCLGTHFRNSLKIGRLDKINPLF